MQREKKVKMRIKKRGLKKVRKNLQRTAKGRDLCLVAPVRVRAGLGMLGDFVVVLPAVVREAGLVSRMIVSLTSFVAVCFTRSFEAPTLAKAASISFSAKA